MIENSATIEEHMEPQEILQLCDDKVYLTGLTFDTGASSNVVGSLWVNNYKRTLPQNLLKHWTQKKSPARFRFGDNTPVEVAHIQRIPLRLKNKVIFYEAHEVPGRCPALEGLRSMRRMKAVIDCGNDQLSIPNTLDAPLILTSKNHHLLPLS